MNRWGFHEQAPPEEPRPGLGSNIYPHAIDHATLNKHWLVDNLGRTDQADGVIVFGHHSIDSTCSTHGLSDILDGLHKHRVTAYIGSHPESLKYSVYDHVQLISPSMGYIPQEQMAGKYVKSNCSDKNLLYVKDNMW